MLPVLNHPPLQHSPVSHIGNINQQGIQMLLVCVAQTDVFPTRLHCIPNLIKRLINVKNEENTPSAANIIRQYVVCLLKIL